MSLFIPLDFTPALKPGWARQTFESMLTREKKKEKPLLPVVGVGD